MYKHLNLEQRYQIAAYKKSGCSIREIGQTIGVSAATVSRELRRNRMGGKYDPSFAQRIADNRFKGRSPYRKFSATMQQLVEQKLRLRWSPEQIVGRCKLEGKPIVSIERIYQHVWSNKRQGGDLYTYLRHWRRNRKKYGSRRSRKFASGKVSISQRPDIVTQKAREGDWEVDTIVGAQGKGVILTSIERKTQFTILAKLESKNHKHVQKVFINAFAPYKDQVLTITSDNGLEFAGHKHIAQRLQADYYFAHPYSYWERGMSEHLNKLVRQYIPARSNFSNYSCQDILAIQKQLNQRPRKKLNFRTPNEVFLKFTVALTS
jgi:transposase, IS30 family